ncbi:IS3 family transposase [Candidatus Gracilibacteria bacterium]|nr:IS3 family transposase [Candidatus Gracilibacteria bacterium]
MGLSKHEVKDLALAVWDSYLDEPNAKQPSKQLLGAAFNLSRSNLYYKPKLEPKDNQLRKSIEAVYTKDDTLGCRKVATILGVSKNRVYRVMLKYNIIPRRNKPTYVYNTNKQDKTISDNLLRSDIDQDAYTILFSDIFQFRLTSGRWVYCCFIMRKQTRQILSFCYGRHMTSDLTRTSISRVDLVSDLTDIPVIFHSDQGSQYGAGETIEVLTQNMFTQSMSRPGTPTDNGMAERFVGIFKLAVTKRYRFSSLDEFEEAATKWLTFYNNQRPHGSLNDQSPNEYAKDHNKQEVTNLYLKQV